MTTPKRTAPDLSSLPAGAPARRVRIDLGPSAIRSSAPPCRILGSERKRSPGFLVDC